jgi:cytochrome P450
LHTLHRRIVWRVFTPRRIADLEPFIRGLAAELLDRHVDADGFDVVEEFSTLLPLHVIGELLGLPSEFRERLHALADRIIDRSSTTTADVPDDSVAASQELSAMLADVVALRRATPADDIVTMIINAEIDIADEGPRHLTDDDIVTKFLELAFAGHETVAGLIPNGVVALSWYPDARAQLTADPSLIPNAVEEMLRWDPTSRYQGRWTTRDVSLHGQTIPKDSRVVLITGSATHDERVYEDPELFDIHRPIDVPVSFGYGVHHCIGHALARMEIRVAFEELLRRFPEYEIDETSVVRKLAGNNRALAHLRVTHG